MSEKTKPSTDGRDEIKVEKVDNLENSFKVNCVALEYKKREYAIESGENIKKVDAKRELLYNKQLVEEGMKVALKGELNKAVRPKNKSGGRDKEQAKGQAKE